MSEASPTLPPGETTVPATARAEEEESGPRRSGDGPFIGLMRSLFRPRNGHSLRDTLEGLIEEADAGERSVADHERVLIQNVLALRDLEAVDVMVPRVDIVAVDARTGQAEILDLLSRKPHSRLPVYRETLDDVIGFVHIKDILARIAADEPFTLTEILRKVMIVAPSIGVLELLLEMRRNRLQLALIVDEFGGIDGLVTIEDLVEAIVGEIEDEHDRDTTPQMAPLANGNLLADARVAIEDFEARVGAFLSADEREDIDTLGGLVFSLAGRIPVRGELLRHPSGLEFEVVDADSRRIRRLTVRNLPGSGESRPGD